MTDASLPIGLELNDMRLTESQKDLHGLYDINGVPNNEIVESIFYSEIIKTARAPHITLQLPFKEEGDKYFYDTHKDFHFLAFSYMIQGLPKIVVKRESRENFQICWCLNLGLNIANEQELSSDTGRIQKFDQHWNNMFFQDYFPELWDRSHFDKIIGNLPFLTNWHSYLPKYNIMVPQAWDYCMHDHKALKLFKAKESVIRHSYRMKKTIFSLLRCRMKVDGEWKEIPARKETEALIKRHIDFETHLLPKPQLWGRYYKVRQDELENADYPDTSYIYDVINSDSTNPVAIDSNTYVELDSQEPCTAIHFALENTIATQTNNHSNYTTNPTDIMEGWSPLSTVNLSYGNSSKYTYDSVHVEHAFPLFNRRTHSQSGYYYLPIEHRGGTTGTSTTCVFKGNNAKLTFALADTDPFLDTLDDTSDGDTDDLAQLLSIGATSTDTVVKKDTFNVRVRLCVTKKAVYRDGRYFIENEESTL